MPSQPLPFDPVAEARRHWVERWAVGEHMAAATSLIVRMIPGMSAASGIARESLKMSAVRMVGACVVRSCALRW